MDILIKHSNLTKQKIAAMQIGSEGGLSHIFGKDWSSIGSIGERRNFGKIFKAAVIAGTIAKLEWIRIENSGRFDVYRKK
ncbi:MAG: DUF1413 domain-containing protein [Rhodoferax sp.]|uniref:DUF1413 domain-containing protein n=1 Tax=Rhodoferax sp. TaxID=50421 RepID=UPI0032671027